MFGIANHINSPEALKFIGNVPFADLIKEPFTAFVPASIKVCPAVGLVAAFP